MQLWVKLQLQISSTFPVSKTPKISLSEAMSSWYELVDTAIHLLPLSCLRFASNPAGDVRGTHNVSELLDFREKDFLKYPNENYHIFWLKRSNLLISIEKSNCPFFHIPRSLLLCNTLSHSTYIVCFNHNQRGMTADSKGGACWIFISNYCWLLNSNAAMPHAWNGYLLSRNSPKCGALDLKIQLPESERWERGSPHPHTPGGSCPLPPWLVGEPSPPTSWM